MVRKQGLFFVAVTEASKQETAMICVAEPMLFRRPKSQPGLHPSTGLCVFDELLAGYGDTCSRASWQTYLSPSLTPQACVTSRGKKKYERNQSANKLRVLSQSWGGKKEKT